MNHDSSQRTHGSTGHGKRESMNVEAAFTQYQKSVNADIEQVRKARRRRDLFKSAFLSEPDVVEVIPSGALARGTQRKPIHDVDTIIVFNGDDHPEWGQPGESAADALSYVGGRVNDLLGATNGTKAQAVRLALPRNHAVKCFLDDPEDPDAFTVDAMPALRRDGMLLIPEKLSHKWIPADPEYLIAQVAQAHRTWKFFAPVVRDLKDWAAPLLSNPKVKSLFMEVLALECLPLEGERAQALARFFTAAAAYVRSHTVQDPARVCGPIQADLDVEALAEHLDTAASTAADAVEAEARGAITTATTLWQKILGPGFPISDDGDGDDGAGDGGPDPSPNLFTGLSVAPALTQGLQPRPVRDLPQG